MKPRLRITSRHAFTVVAVALLSALIAPGIAGGLSAQTNPIAADAIPSSVTSRNENPGVLPPNSKPYGNSYGEWGAQWWIWATEQPFATSPLFDESGEFCELGQSGKVWFLAGILVGGTAMRDCSVPTGKFVFFPIANGLSFAPEFGDTEDEIRSDVETDLAGIDVSSLKVVVDGAELDDLTSYRASSPGFVFPIPEGGLLNEFGFEPGHRLPAVSDGWWIMLTPLPKGEHTIQIMASGEDGFELDITYDLSVGR